MKKYALALDLKDDKHLIREYEEYHKKVWPEVLSSIKASGVLNMEIYRTGNRLFMIMEVDDNFSFVMKAKADEANPEVKDWETLMWKYQQALPHSQPGEKWIIMDKIFSL
ncbi:L-rhamnose mutarotase [Chryseobacterium phosphatilyticum]|uniref:L-rhamnose mutarotase n=1 Tax=Chryseobacterium phosphatilyticum TaxID=475075 RepID=A0A316XI58_9FLAO|nr:L-rhamnose mutarotase [Chryseobacterium phosphatilyticum]PWN70490.1 L-rhamnose mutarotase [Chryseobacterium phosphatilyticum]